jgi:hypothetical protein
MVKQYSLEVEGTVVVVVQVVSDDGDDGSLDLNWGSIALVLGIGWSSDSDSWSIVGADSDSRGIVGSVAVWGCNCSSNADGDDSEL